jgi:aromatic ring-opening dioxygenase LigB subunit
MVHLGNGTHACHHRDFALDPALFPRGTLERQVSDEIAVNARRAAQWLVYEARPDIVLLTTPHGIKLDFDYGIYISDEGCGYSTIGNDLDNSTSGGVIPYNISLCVSLASTSIGEDLLANLKNYDHFPVSGIYSYNEEVPIPLNWGEIIPLLLLPQKKILSSSSRLPETSPKPLIWTFPYRRYDHAPDMVPELLQLGAVVMNWAETRPERIGMIVSGDLSHTHQASGPYGYSDASAPYDAAIGRWARMDPCQEPGAKALLEQARALQPAAKSCGFTGYVMWHGMMCHTIALNRPYGQRSFHAQVLVNRNVTYYGMIAATFEPSRDDPISDSRRRKG